MLRLHKFEFLDVYREETFTGMKAIVKQVHYTTVFVCMIWVPGSSILSQLYVATCS